MACINLSPSRIRQNPICSWSRNGNDLDMTSPTRVMYLKTPSTITWNSGNAAQDYLPAFFAPLKIHGFWVYKSKTSVLLSLSFTAPHEAVFANLEMLRNTEPSEGGLNDCRCMWERYLGPFCSEKPQLVHGLLPTVCQRVRETTLKVVGIWI